MKTIRSSAVILSVSLILLCQLAATVSFAQVKYHGKDAPKLVVSGTSTMHDWTMQSTKGTCDAVFTLNAAGQPTALTALSFSTPAESLKSEHSGMDKNAYKALKSSQNAAITYTLMSATIAGGVVKCNGKLTIAGTTQVTDLTATAKTNADGSISISGSKKISMKDYKMDPPTFMLGAVKTGNDVTLQFDLTLTK